MARAQHNAYAAAGVERVTPDFDSTYAAQPFPPSPAPGPHL